MSRPQNYDPDTSKIMQREIRSTGYERDKLTEFYGRPPEEMTFYFPAHIKGRLMPGFLDHLENGLHDLVFSQILLEFCRKFESELDIEVIQCRLF